MAVAYSLHPMDIDYDLHGIMDHASMKHFTGALRTSIFEVVMFLTFVTT